MGGRARVQGSGCQGPGEKRGWTSCSVSVGDKGGWQKPGFLCQDGATATEFLPCPAQSMLRTCPGQIWSRMGASPVGSHYLPARLSRSVGRFSSSVISYRRQAGIFLDSCQVRFS